MSRRTVTRFTLAAALAASATPAAAQEESRTGSFQFTGSFNTDEGLTPRPAPEPAPMPRAKGGFRFEIDIRLSLGRPAPGGCDFDLFVEDVTAAVGRLVPAAVAPPCCAFDCRPACQVVAAPMPRVKVEPGLRLNIPNPGLVPLTGDIGVPLNRGPFDKIQNIDINVGVFGGPGPATACPAPVAAPVSTPPAVRNLSHGTLPVTDDSGGGFQPAPVVAPTPAPGRYVELHYGSPRPCPPPPLAVFPPAAPTYPHPLVGVTAAHPVPPPPAPAQLRWNPAPPANVPAGQFGMMSDVLGRMVTYDLNSVIPPAAVPPVYGVMTTGGCTLPVAAPRAEPMFVPAVRTAAVPAPVAGGMLVPAPARPALVGTWVREVGPVVYVLKVAPDHLTITAATACEVEDGKVVTQEVVLTADYHLARDGTTVVGLITGMDAALGGAVPDGFDPEQMGRELGQVQKAVTDQPFALSVRAYGDALAVGNVRLPEVDGPGGSWSPLTGLGGRYTPFAGKCLPKPKVVKLPAPRTILPPPPVVTSELPPAAGSDLPPPASVGPGYPGGLTPQLRPYWKPPSDLIPPACVPPAAAAPPAPPMAAPTPPPDAPSKGKKGKKKAETADEKMKRLLYQSDGPRQTGGERPSHLTPERIHGGILP